MKSSIFNDLNPAQKKAVRYVHGPSIILAGAGSGKTRVLTYKVLHLIENENIPPEKIVMVTFTNKAASEMKKRVGRPLGFIGTFHSFCAKTLRVYGRRIGLDPNFLIYDSRDQEDLVKSVLKKLRPTKTITPSYILQRISSAKDQLISSERYFEFADGYTSEIVALAYKEYQKALERNGAVDFDDLIFKTVRLFEDHDDILNLHQDKFHYILVDEFQDTNHAQYMLTKLLGSKHKDVTVVGDFSQSIYSWRGAEVRNLEKFRKNFPSAKVFHLEQNYRSTQKILNFAYNVISHNESHPILNLFTKKGGGEDVEVKQLSNEQHEALFVADRVNTIAQSGSYNSIAILYRINAQSRIIEEAFLHAGIPYILIGGTRFYERREIKDVLSYIRLTVNPTDEISLGRVLKIGKRRFKRFKEFYEEIKKRKKKMATSTLIDKIIQRTGYHERFKEDDPDDLSRLENIKELRSVALEFPDVNAFLEQVALVESEYSESEKKQKRGVQMMTLHACKGLEFPHVFIVGVEDGILPHSRSVNDFLRLEEERRLFYVGITRACEMLYLTHTKERFLFGRRGLSLVSRFLEGQSNHESTNYWRSF